MLEHSGDRLVLEHRREVARFPVVFICLWEVAVLAAAVTGKAHSPQAQRIVWAMGLFGACFALILFSRFGRTRFVFDRSAGQLTLEERNGVGGFVGQARLAEVSDVVLTRHLERGEDGETVVHGLALLCHHTLPVLWIDQGDSDRLAGLGRALREWLPLPGALVEVPMDVLEQVGAHQAATGFRAAYAHARARAERDRREQQEGKATLALLFRRQREVRAAWAMLGFSGALGAFAWIGWVLREGGTLFLGGAVGVGAVAAWMAADALRTLRRERAGAGPAA